jgi:hypothetical protein
MVWVYFKDMFPRIKGSLAIAHFSSGDGFHGRSPLMLIWRLHVWFGPLHHLGSI